MSAASTPKWIDIGDGGTISPNLGGAKVGVDKVQQCTDPNKLYRFTLLSAPNYKRGLRIIYNAKATNNANANTVLRITKIMGPTKIECEIYDSSAKDAKLNS